MFYIVYQFKEGYLETFNYLKYTNIVFFNEGLEMLTEHPNFRIIKVIRGNHG